MKSSRSSSVSRLVIRRLDASCAEVSLLHGSSGFVCADVATRASFGRVVDDFDTSVRNAAMAASERSSACCVVSLSSGSGFVCLAGLLGVVSGCSYLSEVKS